MSRYMIEMNLFYNIYLIRLMLHAPKAFSSTQQRMFDGPGQCPLSQVFPGPEHLLLKVHEPDPMHFFLKQHLMFCGKFGQCPFAKIPSWQFPAPVFSHLPFWSVSMPWNQPLAHFTDCPKLPTKSPSCRP